MKFRSNYRFRAIKLFMSTYLAIEKKKRVSRIIEGFFVLLRNYERCAEEVWASANRPLFKTVKFDRECCISNMRYFIFYHV